MIRQSKNERGMALIVVLFALMLLTAIGLGLMYMTTTETGIDSNFRSAQQAYYASKAGLEEGRDRLRYITCNGSTCLGAYPSNNSSYYIPGLSQFSGGWKLPTTSPAANTATVVYIINSMGSSDPVTPWTAGSAYFDDELCHENFSGLGLTGTPTVPCATAPSGTSWYQSVTSTDPNTGTSSATPYKWVRITLKQDNSPPYCADYNGSSCPLSARRMCIKMNGASPYLPPYYETPLPTAYATCDADNMRTVYLVTSLAKLSNGSRKMTQYEVANMVIPPLPGAITFDGSGPNFNPPTSNSFKVYGNDNCGVAPSIPALAAYDNNAQNTLSNDITAHAGGNLANNYQGAGGSLPSVVNSTSTIGALSTITGLQNLTNNITSSADQTYTGNNPSISSLGTTSNPLITVVNGDYTLSNTMCSQSAPCAGILLVTGVLSTSGNPNFDGVILVIGKGDVEWSGGGNGTINGGIFIANVYQTGTTNWLPTTSNPNPPTFNYLSGGGGGTFQLNYDSCWSSKVSSHSPLRVVASHEEVY